METFSQNKIAEKELLELARKKVKKRRDFYIHTMVFAVGIVFWLLKTHTDFTLDFFPVKHINWFVMAIWTVAYVLQGVELLISELIFGKKWEEKQMKQLLENRSEKQTWE